MDWNATVRDYGKLKPIRPKEAIIQGMKIKRKLGSEKGQALVETAIIIIIMLAIIFGIMQLALIGTATIVAQDAAYFAARAEVVGKSPKIAGWYVMESLRKEEDVRFSLPMVSSETHSEFNEVVEGKITYFQRVLSLFSVPVFNPLRTVTCKMVKSPREEFYDKSFER